MSLIPLRATIAVTAALVMTAVPGHAGQMQMRQIDDAVRSFQPSTPQPYPYAGYLGVDTRLPNDLRPSSSPAIPDPSRSLSFPTVPLPTPRPANEFWVRPVPLPQAPGVIGGGRVGDVEFQGHIFHTPQGPTGGVGITYPAVPETVVKDPLLRHP